MTRQCLEVKTKLDKAGLFEALKNFPSLPRIPVTGNGLSPYIRPGWEESWWDWLYKIDLPPEFWFSRSVSTLRHWTRGGRRQGASRFSAAVKLEAMDSVGSRADHQFKHGTAYRPLRPTFSDQRVL